MKPVALHMTAFGPYVGSESVDFSQLGDQGLFLIHGPTGSGKSSILDALCYALFDATSSGERTAKDLPSAYGRTQKTRVILEFDHKGRRYRVTRHPTQPRLGEHTTTDMPGDALLEDITGLTDTELTGEVLAEKTTSVNNTLRDLLGCSVEQFRQTVVLPQGAFRQVITDAKTRRDVLKRIFDTERFERLADKLKIKTSELRKLHDATGQQRRDYLADAEAETPEELALTIDGVAEEVETLRKSRDAAATELQKKITQEAEAKNLHGLFEERAAVMETLAALAGRADEVEAARARMDLGKRAASLEDTHTALNEAHKAVTDAARAEEAAATAYGEATTAVEEARKGSEAEQKRSDERDESESHLHSLEKIREDVEALGTLESELEAARTIASEKQVDLEAAETALAEAKLELEGLVTTIEANAEQLQRETTISTEKRRLVSEVDALATIAELEATLARARESLAELQAGKDSVASLIERMSDHAAGALASELQPGEPCPVCGSEEHPAPHPSAGGWGQLKTLLERFAELREQIAKLEEKIDGATKRRDEILSAHDWTLPELPSPEELGKQLQEVSNELTELEQLKVEQNEAAKQRSNLAQSIPGLEESVTSARTALDASRARVQELQGRLGGIRDKVPEEHRDPASFTAALDAAKERHDELAKAWRDVQEGLDTAKHVLELAGQRRELKRDALGEAKEQLCTKQERFDERLREKEFVDIDAFLAARVEQTELQKLETTVAEFDRNKQSAITRRDVLDAKLADESPPDLDAVAAEKEAAQEKFDEQNDLHSAQKTKLSRLQTLDTKIRELGNQVEQIRERFKAAQSLSDLASGQVSGRARVGLETFVMQSIFHEVLGVGNTHLTRMTGGRYSLRLLLDDSIASSSGLELIVEDHHGGGDARAVHTLSGGEGFQASLALALGLSEIAQRRSGGAELGALFIDEGFGSLDPASLDQAVSTLRSLPTTGNRMVGVISHVGGLKQKIPTQVLIEPGPNGSRIRVEVNA